MMFKRKFFFLDKGKNGDLELELDFQDNAEQFEIFSIGELVPLPRELFIVPETAPYQPKYEHF